MQAVDGEGKVAPWSRPAEIELGEKGGDESGSGLELGGGYRTESMSANRLVLLVVPFMIQHKDSRMLLLESDVKKGPHSWDSDHQIPRPFDDEDNFNAPLANVAMVNRYWGGDLTQDRIGYEVLSRNVRKYRSDVAAMPVYAQLRSRPGFVNWLEMELEEETPGPERDLIWGDYLDLPKLAAAFAFALGAVPNVEVGSTTTKDLWTVITGELDAGRPVVFGTDLHSVTIYGYRQVRGRREVYLNDPARGQYRRTINRMLVGPNDYLILTFPNHPRIARQEPGMTTDTDGDGVIDFDETERFKTDPSSADTDKDLVPDKRDIESSVFDVENYYVKLYSHRDYDGDRKASELDPDSDEGGCKDGDEDLNQDGVHNGSETYNMDDTDDICSDLQGHLSYQTEVKHPNPGSFLLYGVTKGVIFVRLKPEPLSPDHFIDKGSTFRYQAFGRTEIRSPKCVASFRTTSSGGGLFVPPEGEIAASVGDDGTVAVSAEMSTPGRTEGGGCSIPYGSMPYQSSLGWPDCVGQKAPPARRAGVPPIYRFNCSKSVTLPDGSVSIMQARGYLRLAPK